MATWLASILLMAALAAGICDGTQQRIQDPDKDQIQQHLHLQDGSGK